jgi:hypothetical protein
MAAHEAGFWLGDIIFARPRNGLETQDCDACEVINRGVDSMTLILRLIYREYCRSCLLH